ncbi:MAG: hypothetical protein AAF152_17890 [Cyanobacteria bacterium P01_A01_bin.114]
MLPEKMISNPERAASIRWAWLMISCISLLTGAVYLEQVSLQEAPPFSQAQQP